MTQRTMAAVLAATLLGGSTLVLAAGGAVAPDEQDWPRDEIRDSVRDAVREAGAEVRASVHDVRHVVRDALRDAGYASSDAVLGLVHEVVHDVADDVRETVAWVWADAAAHDHDHDWQDRADRAERRRESVERRREAAERRRERAEARRDETARQRDARAFREVSPTDDPCSERRGDRDRGHACEVRDTRLPAPVGPLTVDAAPNGGIRVEAWDQADVLVRAVVQTWADDDAAAKAMLPGIQVTAAGTQVSATGPDRNDGRRRSGWSVGYRIWAPRQTALSLTSRNGGVSLHGMGGESRFSTTNGGVTLDEVSGRVVGRTRNGGVTVRLAGARWAGEGLEVETTNGGVSLAIPPGYSAELETSTVNGGFRSDYPLTVQGRIDRQVRATLGSGGPLLKVSTTNGGVRILQR